MVHKVKISVLKRTFNQEYVENYTDPAEKWEPCEVLRDGQEWVTEGTMPEGFCSWAWRDIHTYVITLARGGNFDGTKPGVFISNCTDGYRPVFFKIERVG